MNKFAPNMMKLFNGLVPGIYFHERLVLQLPVCFPGHQTISKTESTLKGKNLIQRGTNSFILEKTCTTF